MPASKHRRQGRKRPLGTSPTYEHDQVVDEILHTLLDNRCRKLYGTTESASISEMLSSNSWPMICCCATMACANQLACRPPMRRLSGLTLHAAMRSTVRAVIRSGDALHGIHAGRSCEGGA
jgi:hypothetical protein